MTDASTETWPDLPPIVDERAYQECLVYIRSLQDRGVTGDVRTEHGALLLKLRRACELYERAVQPSLFASVGRTLVIQPCDCGECGECRERAKLRVAEATIRALKVALETTLKHQGAGESPYARSQPSDACEIEQWKAHAEGAWEDEQTALRERDAAKERLERERTLGTTLAKQVVALQMELKTARADVDAARRERDEWRAAWGPFGPQTPAEVAVYEQESRRVDRETAAHEAKYVAWLSRRCGQLGRRLHVKRAEARIWAEKAGWEDEYQRQTLRDGREIVALRVKVKNQEARMEEIQHCCDKAVANRAALIRVESVCEQVEKGYGERTEPYCVAMCEVVDRVRSAIDG